MAMERYFQEAAAWNDSDEDEISLKKWESAGDTVDESENNPSNGFDCKICLDVVQDPVVTFCGHLYCWPCIYKWMNGSSVSPENPVQQQPQCPVCRAEVSERTLVPLYGPGQNAKSSEGKGTHLGIIVPPRLSFACGRIHTPVISATAHSAHPAQQFRRHLSHPQQPRSYDAQPTPELAGVTTDSLNPMAGSFGEMVYTRIFGNSDSGLYAHPNSYHLAGSNSPRVRRLMMQADQSLSRICLFLCCFAVFCLLTF